MKSVKEIRLRFLLKSNRYEVKDVFTPSCEATFNFIRRKKIEKKFDSFYKQKGRQLFIYGYSRSGKSSFWENQVKQKSIRCITSRCKGDTKFVDLVRDCFNQLNPYYVSTRTSIISREIKRNFEADFRGLKSSASASVRNDEGLVSETVLPPQITAQNLVRYVCEAGLVWVIEDFHYLDDESKTQLAYTLKFFIDESVKYPYSRVVCIGTSMDLESMYIDNPDLHSRIAHIPVNAFDFKEIQDIVDNGFELLNVEVSNKVRKKIVECSANDASVAHNLCFELCNQAGITESSLFKKQIPNNLFPKTLSIYASQNQTQFDQKLDYINGNEVRKRIVSTFRELKENTLSQKRIVDHLEKERHKEADIKSELQNLSDDSCDILRYDTILNKYSFRNQFFKVYLDMILEKESNMARLDAMLQEAWLLFKNQNDDDAMLWQSLSKNLEELIARMEEE